MIYKVENISFTKTQDDEPYYPKDVITEMLADPVFKDKLDNNMLVVECDGDPTSLVIDLMNVCAVVKNLYIENDSLLADIDFIDTKYGKLASEVKDKLHLKLSTIGEAKSDGEVVNCQYVKLFITLD